jgi:hypothetical protein
VPINEAINAILASQCRLSISNFGYPQVVEPELARKARLDVPREQGLGRSYILPLREAWLPPLVVLWDGMELRQVKGEHKRARKCSSFDHAKAYTDDLATQLFHDRQLWRGPGCRRPKAWLSCGGTDPAAKMPILGIH